MNLGIDVIIKFYLLSLNLTDPPVITTDLPTNLTVRPGERFYLECEAIGNPIPHVYWKTQGIDYFNGSLLFICHRKSA